jgi:hypothetical protein
MSFQVHSRSSGTQTVEPRTLSMRCNYFLALLNLHLSIPKSTEDAAPNCIKARLRPKQFQIFDLTPLNNGRSPKSLAPSVSALTFTVNKHRVASALRRELSRLRHEK